MVDILKLNEIANRLVARKKGILAADESSGTIAKRFNQYGIEDTEENRRRWRQLLFTSQGVGEFLSGVILFEETLYQKCDDGTEFVEFLSRQGIVPGIKVDRSTHPLANTNGEVITEGLDGLRGRLSKFYEQGARFTKWRAVLKIGAGIPSDLCINLNVSALARYAALSQEQGLVPIVEPEVLMDGDHPIERCYEATETTLRRLFNELGEQGVDLRGIVLKPNMVISATDNSSRVDAKQVAEATLCCFGYTVPQFLPGIAFLSGGQGDEESLVNLNEISRLASAKSVPWELTFSYGRGLQSAAMETWKGQPENVEKAQQVFSNRLRDVAQAREGNYRS